jgi:mRNA-degrading endonuclease toxin of MazEF toxin-antitoxin module
MTNCKVGDIVSVQFPFSDLQGQKRRPGLVLAADDNDVLLARLTTHPPREASDVALNRWASVGLPRASTVRLAKLVTVDGRLVHHRIGRLHPEDATAVSYALQQLASGIAAELRK